MASRRVGRQNTSASDDAMTKYEIYTAQWRRAHALIGAGSICTQNPAWVCVFESDHWQTAPGTDLLVMGLVV